MVRSLQVLQVNPSTLYPPAILNPPLLTLPILRATRHHALKDQPHHLHLKPIMAQEIAREDHGRFLQLRCSRLGYLEAVRGQRC